MTICVCEEKEMHLHPDGNAYLHEPGSTRSADTNAGLPMYHSIISLAFIFQKSVTVSQVYNNMSEENSSSHPKEIFGVIF